VALLCLHGASSRKVFRQGAGCIRSRAGMVRMSTLLASASAGKTFYAMRDRGVLEQLSRGHLSARDLPPLGALSLVTVATRVRKEYLPSVSALSFHELTTQVPHEVDVGARARKARASAGSTTHRSEVSSFCRGCFPPGHARFNKIPTARSSSHLQRRERRLPTFSSETSSAWTWSSRRSGSGRLGRSSPAECGRCLLRCAPFRSDRPGRAVPNLEALQ